MRRDLRWFAVDAVFGALLLGACLAMGACGAKEEEAPTTPYGAPEASPAPAAPKAAAALRGEGWIGGEGPGMSGPSDRLRVVAFFKPT